MWKINEESLMALNFEDVSPLEILFEFNGPQIFTFLQGMLQFLAYTSFDNEELGFVRLLVVSTNTLELQKLKQGGLSIEDVLKKDLVWVVDRSHEGVTTHVALLPHGLNDVPDGFKPKSGILLWAHLKREGLTRSPASQKVALQGIAALTEKFRRAAIDSERVVLRSLLAPNVWGSHDYLEMNESLANHGLSVRSYFDRKVSAMMILDYAQQTRDEERFVKWLSPPVEPFEAHESRENEFTWYAKQSRSDAHG